ncbi:hypothetical protein ILUMI_10317 [Ignelater luminosus]|uniref:Uncharacterized protein n=1 Tax=Ignelater luminosus TaxID=2038154 RepID=A0A8K0CYC7_IGNLU|nr:hypothetical protein ILUMI_10317 [Ignelater luminosus]
MRELEKSLLRLVPLKAETIKVEARRECREAAEKLRDYGMEMLVIIRYLKEEIEGKDRQIATLKAQGGTAATGGALSSVGTAPRGYAAAATRPKPTRYAVKVTAKETKDADQVEKILKFTRASNFGRRVVTYALADSDFHGRPAAARLKVKQIPEKSDSIKVEARRTCREATEKLRNHALEMLGIIRFLKLENKRMVKENNELKRSVNRTVGEVDQVIVRENINKGYANAVLQTKPPVFAIKVTSKNIKDSGNVEKLLKTNVDPSKINVSIAGVKKITSGGVIVECNNKKDAEKLKLVVEASKDLQGKAVENGNPRIIVHGVDNELNKESLMTVISKNNNDLVEACGGIEEFKKQVREV